MAVNWRVTVYVLYLTVVFATALGTKGKWSSKISSVDALGKRNHSRRDALYGTGRMIHRPYGLSPWAWWRGLSSPWDVQQNRGRDSGWLALRVKSPRKKLSDPVIAFPDSDIALSMGRADQEIGARNRPTRRNNCKDLPFRDHCYKAWRYGCDCGDLETFFSELIRPSGCTLQKYCWRSKYQTNTGWGWFDNGVGGYVKCNGYSECLGFWRALEEKIPEDMPCYLSTWKKNHCYKGKRWDCDYEMNDLFNNPTGFDYFVHCWYENPKVSGKRETLYKFDTNDLDECDRCEARALAKIDRFKDDRGWTTYS